MSTAAGRLAKLESAIDVAMPEPCPVCKGEVTPIQILERRSDGLLYDSITKWRSEFKSPCPRCEGDVIRCIEVMMTDYPPPDQTEEAR